MRGTFKERFALPLLVVIAVSGLLAGAYVVSDMGRPLRGTVRPELRLTSLGGTSTRLPSPFFCKHIILLFSPACPHCRTELEHFALLSEMMPDVPVFGISFGPPGLTDSLMVSVRATFPAFLDGDGSVRTQLGITRVPVVLFVGEDDVIRLSLTGARSFQEDSLLFARFSISGAPGTTDAGRLGGTDIRTSPGAPVEDWNRRLDMRPQDKRRRDEGWKDQRRLDKRRQDRRSADERGKDQRQNEQRDDVPTACLAGVADARTEPVGPRAFAGMSAPPDGPRQAAGPFTHSSISLSKKEVPSCVPGSQG